MIFQGKARYPVREAVLHCAAIKTGQFKGWSAFQVFSEINRWHLKRGFKNGFGYHGLFMPDGEFYSGRPYEQIGAHVIDHNRGTLGFLMIESEEIKLPRYFKGDEAVWLDSQRFDRWYTTDQRLSVVAHLREIDGLWKVSGHNDYAQRLCPGFRVHTKYWL